MKSKKTLTIILWLLFVVCIFPTVYLNRAVANSDPDYEEVDVTVVSSETVTLTSSKSGSLFMTWRLRNTVVTRQATNSIHKITAFFLFIMHSIF